MRHAMLSTSDNPYNPFDEFKAWYAFDVAAGYHTSSFLAKVAVSSTELSDADEQAVIEAAIDEIVRENITGVFIKVVRDIPDESEGIS